jgi:hypothetical protein
MVDRERVLSDALALAPADQVVVLRAIEEHLAESIEPETAESLGIDDDELLKELQRRSAAYRNGSIAAREAGDVMKELRDRQQSEFPK